MKKLFYVMAMVLLTFTNCSEEETIEQSVNPFARISATIEQESPTSRVEINPNNTMNFSEGDVARIFTQNGYYNYVYDNTGAFFPKTPDQEIPPTTSSADIIGAYLEGIDDYGSDASSELNGNTLGISIAQSIVMENRSPNCVKIPMWGTWNGQSFYFKHLAGVLRLNLKNLPADYDFLTVKTSNPIVGGTAVVEDITDPQAVFKIIEGGENLTYIKFAGGVVDKTVYVALPVGQYEYIQVLMSKYNPDNSEGELDNPIVMAHYTDKTIERGKIYTAPSAMQTTTATLPKDVSEALKGSASQQIMTIPNELDATANDAGHIEIPATLNSLSFDFRTKPKTDANHPLVIKSNSGATPTTAQKMVHIYMPKDADEVYLEIDAPTTTVTLNYGVYQKVIATTADETLIINEETTVKEALIHHGCVRVYGTLENITSDYNGTLTIYKEIDGTIPSSLPQNIAAVDIAKEQFFAKLANATADDEIYLEGDITIDEPIQITKSVRIDLNGYSIDAPKSDAFIVTDGTLNLQGGKVYCNSTNAGNYSIVKVNGSNAKAIIGFMEVCELQGIVSGVTPNGCIYVGENGGTIEITGGTYKYTGQIAVNNVNQHLINQADNLTQQCIFITYGSFYNFNPVQAETGDAWMTSGVGSYAAPSFERAPGDVVTYGLLDSMQEGNDWLYVVGELPPQMP